jgi:putative transposase
MELIRKMSVANPRWGAPRIHGELLKLGFELSEATVAKYMVRPRKPPSQTWRTFLANHAKDLVSLISLWFPRSLSGCCLSS